MKDPLLKDEVAAMLQWQGAHVAFADAVEDIPFELLGKTPCLQDALPVPYSIWQLVEHIRIAQHDIVSFCLDDDYRERQWPEDYWPATKAPDTKEFWQQAIQAVHHDRQRMVQAVLDPASDLLAPIARGDGQHLLREAILVIDHEAYHTGQIVLIRRMLGHW